MRKKIILGVIILLIVVLLVTPAIAKPKKTPPGHAKAASAQATTAPTTTTPQPAATTEPAASSTETTSEDTTSEVAAKETDWEKVGAIVGILAIIGGLIGWYVSKKRRSKSSGYLKNINETFNEYKSDTSKCEANLYLLKEKIEKDFTDGKIDEQSLQLLHGRIEKYLKNVRMGIVDGLDVSPDAKKELSNMLKDGKISEEEYDAFVKSKTLSEKDKGLLSKHMAKWKRKDK